MKIINNFPKEIKQYDAFGEELHIGDQVIYTGYHYALWKGVILKINEKFVTIKYLSSSLKQHHDWIDKRLPKFIAKLPLNEQKYDKELLCNNLQHKC